MALAKIKVLWTEDDGIRKIDPVSLLLQNWNVCWIDLLPNLKVSPDSRPTYYNR